MISESLELGYINFATIGEMFDYKGPEVDFLMIR